MKPGQSFLTKTDSLSILCATSKTICTVSLEVRSPLMISTSSINWGGLKKWNPQKFSGFWTADANSFIGMDDVLVAIIVRSFAWQLIALRSSIFVFWALIDKHVKGVVQNLRTIFCKTRRIVNMKECRWDSHSRTHDGSWSNFPSDRLWHSQTYVLWVEVYRTRSVEVCLNWCRLI